MQGILVMDKPAGFTSFDVVAKLRGICGTRRIGHTGTLDPMATGVLPVFIGGAAKAVDLQQNHDKTYEAVLLLGTRTDTGDVTGTVLETRPVPPDIDAAAVRAVLPRFVGEGEQLPPMYSAVKIDGQPLYKAARAGKIVERKPRPVVIYEIELRGTPAQGQFALRIRCGKGTYVRVLLEDIAAALGTIGTMQALRRTQAGAYTLAEARTFPQVQAAKDAGVLADLLVGVETVFAHLPAVRVNEDTRARLYNGAPTYKFYASDGDCRAYAGEEFLGLCSVQGGVLRAKKLFVEREG
ncbi:MAG: tRNA pseudouridine(55) synthase TruB [Ruthenibacterium sp.]